MNILVVDDETDMQPLFEQRFRKEIRQGKISFAFANSGEQAIAYMEDSDHHAVLILSDINMPGMSGLDLLRYIKRKYEVPPPTVMMVTAYGDQQIYSEAMRLGADGFLTKPIDFTLLKEKLNIAANGQNISSR